MLTIAPAVARRRTAGLVAAGFGALAGVGTLLPWATITIGRLASISRDGIQYPDGKIAAAGACAAILFGLLVHSDPGNSMGVLTLIAGIGIVGVVGLDYQDITDRGFDVGIGLVISGLGGLGVMVAAIVWIGTDLRDT